ncbi:peptidylprolyl isomerase [Engelhardtia mirabilis]|uniref:peptidylprolyl isomerase n=1 Tax=Engelhardtia mirabilis TaxID=2528011 RepID=A0A518BPP4_9BACT|nr:peptidylprolyl isomerase [Planctomycetes bacterium Pla133]QDV03281.1 peptidylprolyl isomerase [Planctomycetes bacterium Pla86]
MSSTNSPSNRVHRTLLATLAFGLLLGSGALCAPASGQEGSAAAAPAAATSRLADRQHTEGSQDPVLLINGEPISQVTFENWMLDNRGETFASTFALAVAIEWAAERAGITIDDASVNAIVQAEIQVRVDNVFGGDRAGWIAELAVNDRTEAGYVAQQMLDVRSREQARALANIDRVVPEAKIVRDWELQYGPQGTRLGVRGLKRGVQLVSTRTGLTVGERNAMVEERTLQARTELEGLRARIAGGETLAFLAKQLSDDEDTASRGGLFDGPFDPLGWPNATTDALLSLPVGPVSEPLQGRGGLWLFEVVSRSVTPLESVREQLHQALVLAGPESDEINDVVVALADSTTIEVGDALAQDDFSDRSAAAVLIDGEAVDLHNFARWLRLQNGETVSRRFAEERLIEHRAAEAGIVLTEAEIQAQIREDRERIVKLGHDGNEDKWLQVLDRSGRTVESWTRGARERAEITVLAEKLWLKDRVVTDQEVRDLWANRYGIDGISVAARLIAKSFEMPERLEDEPERTYNMRILEAARPDYDELVELGLRVEDGEDFGALARQYSEDSESAALGGMVPGGFDITAWPEIVRTALGGLRPGEVTPPVLVENTLYLFEVTEYVETTLDSVAEALRAELLVTPPTGVALAAFRNELTRDLSYEILPAMRQ